MPLFEISQECCTHMFWDLKCALHFFFETVVEYSHKVLHYYGWKSNEALKKLAITPELAQQKYKSVAIS